MIKKIKLHSQQKENCKEREKNWLPASGRESHDLTEAFHRLHDQDSHVSHEALHPDPSKLQVY